MNTEIDQLLDRAHLLVHTQQLEKAMSIYYQIIEADRNCDEAYLLRAELYQKLGKTEKAFEDVHKAIRIDPNYEVAHLVLASLHRSQGDLGKAIQANQQAIRLNGSNQQAIKHINELYVMLADKQLASHQPEKAVENYWHAIKYNNNSNLLYRYAFALSRMGNFDQAIQWAKKILESDNNHVAAKSLMATIHEKIGEIDKGWTIISELVQVYPENPSINITYGKYALRNRQQDSAINKLKNVLNQSELTTDDELSISMLIGKLYDSIADYNNAFTYFTKANNLKYNDYDIKTFEDQITNIISYFSKEKYNKLPSSNISSAECLFILGMPRSGTSLIEQIVSSHSKVYGAGELQYVPKLVQSMQLEAADLKYPQLLENISSDELDGYAKMLLKSMQALSPTHQKITDKLPHNFLFIGLIHKLLPNAKIINCERNPIDACLSCYFQHFGGYHPYAYNLTHLGKYYKQYSRLMRHWQEELNIPIFTVQYENLVQDTRYEVEEILNYIELNWEDTCLEFYNQKRTVNTSSYTQVSKKIYTGSINRWLNYKKYINELIISL